MTRSCLASSSTAIRFTSTTSKISKEYFRERILTQASSKLILSRVMPRLLSLRPGVEATSDLELAQQSLNALASLHDELTGHDYIHYIPSECFGTSISTTVPGVQQADDALIDETCVPSSTTKARGVPPTGAMQVDKTSRGTEQGLDFTEDMDTEVLHLVTGIAHGTTLDEGRDTTSDLWFLEDAKSYSSVLSGFHDLEPGNLFTNTP